MKNFVLCLLFAAVSVFANAKPRSGAESEELARNFFSRKEGSALRSATNDVKLLYSASQISGTRSGESEAFLIFGKEENGFVVISGDDSQPPVLAYSDGGTFSPDNAPDALLEILNSYSANFDKTKIIRAKSEGQTLRSSSSVEPLLGDIMYGQTEPFNDKVPEYKGEKAMTGCGAVALAQIMKYYEYPKSGRGTVSYKTERLGLDVNVDLNHEYDWENTLDFYEKGNYTDAQREAISTLLLHCGAAANMEYFADDDGSSGSKEGGLISALINKFGYDKNINNAKREAYSLEEWIDLLKSELECGRPIMYSGTTAKEVGHMFLIDGYDYDDMFHVNWGWSGSYNGYYAIELLDYKPYFDGSGASSSFFFRCSAIMGIQPPTEDSKCKHSIFVGCPMKVSKESVSRFGTFDLSDVAISNLGVDFEGEFALVLCDENDSIAYFMTDAIGVELERNVTKITSLGYLRIPQSVKSGKYKITAAMRCADEEEWSLAYEYKSSGYCVWVDVSSSSLKFSHEEVEILLKDASVSVLHNLYENTQADFLLNVTNFSDEEYIDAVGLKLTSKSGDEEQVLLRNGYMPAGSSAEFRVSEVLKLPAGEYVATPVYSDLKEYVEIEGSKSLDVTILPEITTGLKFDFVGDVTIDKDTVYAGDVVTVKATLQNVGSPYNGYVSVCYFKKVKKVVGDSVANESVSAGRSDEYLFMDTFSTCSFEWSRVVSDTGCYVASIYYLEKNTFKLVDSVLAINFVVLPEVLTKRFDTDSDFKGADNIALASDGVVLTGALAEGCTVKDVKIYHANGTAIPRASRSICGNRFELPISDIKQGIYMLRIETDDKQTHWRKIVL